MIKYLVLAAVAAASLVLASPAVAQIPENGDVCSNIDGIQLVPPAGFESRLLRENGTTRLVCQRIPATPVPPTPVATPVVVTVTRVVLIQCQGPYNANAPYALPVNFYGNLGLPVYPWGGLFNWPVPTLVTKVDGVITSAIANAPECMPAEKAAPVATATPVPAQIVVVQQPAAAAPVQSAPVTQPSVIRVPNTGSAGLAAE